MSFGSFVRQSVSYWSRRYVQARFAFDEREIDGVTVELAETTGDFLAAGRVLHDAYARRGLIDPHPSRLWFGTHGLLPTTLTFVAKRRGHCVGTIALAFDSKDAGLPFDALYPKEIGTLRTTGARLAEVGALAIEPGARKTGIMCLFNRILLDIAFAVGLTKVVIAVHPKAEVLYTTALQFERLAAERSHPSLGAPAVGLVLDLATFRARSVAAHGDAKTLRNPHYLFVDATLPQVRLPSLEPAHGRSRIAMAQAAIEARPDLVELAPASVRNELRMLAWRGAVARRRPQASTARASKPWLEELGWGALASAEGVAS